MKTLSFGLKRVAKLLSLILALSPVSHILADSAAPVGPLSNEFGIRAVEDPDAGYVYEAAGMESIAGFTSSQSSALISYLDDLFTTNFDKYKTAGALDDTSSGPGTDVDTLFDNYNSAAKAVVSAMSALGDSSTTADVQNVINLITGQTDKSLMSLLTIFMAAYFSNIDQRFLSLAAQSYVDPLTNSKFLQARPTMPPDVYAANAFRAIFADLVSRLATLNNDMTAAVQRSKNSKTNNRNTNANQRAINTAAQGMGITPAELQKIISVSGCSSNATIAEQISCAQHWYGIQQGYLHTINKNIGYIEKATNKINGSNGSINAAAEDDIDGYVHTYTGNIDDATSVVDIKSEYSDGVEKINSVYPGLIGAHGSIQSLQTAVAGYEAIISADKAKVNTAIFGSQLDAVMNGYPTVQAAWKGALSSVQKQFPNNLPIPLSSTNVSGYTSSVPGKAVEELLSAMESLTDPISEVETVVSNLSNALGSAQSSVKNAPQEAVSSMSTATTYADLSNNLKDAVQAVNNAYRSVVAQGSAFEVALTKANTLNSQLATLAQTHPHLADIATAQQKLSPVISNAEKVFPSGVTFTVANATSTYSSSAPGVAIVSVQSSFDNAQVTLASTLGTKLSGATTAAQSTIQGDQKAALASISDVSSAVYSIGTDAEVESALNNGVTAINNSYQTIMGLGSDFQIALTNATNMNNALLALEKTDSSLSGLSAAQQKLGAAISSAQAAFPVLPSGTKFTVANSGTTYKGSTPGVAITALNTSATLKEGQIKLAITSSIEASVAILAGLVLLGLGGYQIYKWKTKTTEDASEGVDLTEVNNEIDAKIQKIVQSGVDPKELSEDLRDGVERATGKTLATTEAVEEAVTDLTAEEGQSVVGALPEAVQEVVQSATVDGLGDAFGISDEEFAAFEDLLDSAGSLDAGVEALNTTLTDAVDVDPNDLLQLAQTDMPDGVSTNMADRFDLIDRVIEANPELDINNPEAFKDAAEKLSSSTTDPTKPGEGSGSTEFNDHMGIEGLDALNTFNALKGEVGESVAIDKVNSILSEQSSIVPKVTPDDVLKAIQANTPEGGNLADTADLISKALEANPALNITDADGLKAAVEELNSPTTDPTKPTKPDKGSGQGSGEDPKTDGGKKINTGSGSGTDPDSGSSIFKNMSGSTEADQVKSLEDYITEHNITESEFKAELASVKDTIETLEDKEQKGTTLTEEEKQQLLDAKDQVKAGEGVEDDDKFTFPEGE